VFQTLGPSKDAAFVHRTHARTQRTQVSIH
jgi:hypothetical protein